MIVLVLMIFSFFSYKNYWRGGSTYLLFSSLLISLQDHTSIILSVYNYINTINSIPTTQSLKYTSMASAPFISSSEPTKVDASNISSIKAFAQSNEAFPIPSSYHSLTEPDDIVDVTEELAASIPVIDFSLLTSDDLEIHTKAVYFEYALKTQVNKIQIFIIIKYAFFLAH